MTAMTAYHWFKPKTYGYGAYPVTWKGWALIAGFVAAEVLLGLALVYLILPLRADGLTITLLTALVAVAMIVLAWSFIRLSQAKTEGGWRWRWGARGGG